MPSAPLATSSQSRKKLKTSEYYEKSAIGEADKENNTSTEGLALSGTPETREKGNVGEYVLPQTPAVRFRLEDLIGNTEDAFNCAPPAATPTDHVLWQTGSRSSVISIPEHELLRGQKRVHSSSPSSSQFDRLSAFESNKDPLNLESMQKSLRSPHDDPTLELWNRYTHANPTRPESREVSVPAFNNLFPSSPQTPSTTSKDSALRRTVSCGIEWPTSKPKRRRVDAVESLNRAKDLFAASKREILAQELPKTSRVSLLVEKIQESLSKRVHEENLSSSSPLPERHAPDDVSPTRQGGKINAQAQTSFDLQKHIDSEKDHLNAEQLGHDGSSSEFGDEGLDIEFFKSVELATVQRPEESSISENTLTGQATSLRNHNNPNPNQNETSTNMKLPKISGAPAQVAASTRQDVDDEFDDDDDFFTDELQNLAAKLDSQDSTLKRNDATSNTDHIKQSNCASMKPIAELEESFDDDDDLWKDIINEKSAVGSVSQNIMNNSTIKRYLIVDVLESQFENSRGRKQPEKMLSVKDERSKMLYIVLLRQSWYETRCTKGSYIHVIGEFDRTGQCIIDDVDNMIILHPDHLISSTVVGDSFTCTRRAALQDRIKATSAAQKPQVYGHILHEVFGQALQTDRWDSSSFRSIIQQVIPNYIESLYEIGVSIPEASEYLMGKAPELTAWASIFVGDEPPSDAVIRDRNGGLIPTAINKSLELEEHIWSPMYGLKGNIDATVQVKMQFPGEKGTRTLIAPFELKTGKKDNVETHRAQTALYTLLLSDRYDINVTCGVLYYLETSKTFRVEAIKTEIRHMIIERNELACYVHDKLDLPPMIKKAHQCKSCYSKTECFTYHRLTENGDEHTSGMGEAFNEVVRHLSPAHQTFFKKWDDLLTREERDSMKFRRELWTMLSTEREKLGRCFADVTIEPGSGRENPESTKINRFEYSFVKHKPNSGFSFTESQITIGEPIVISDQKGHFNFASGYVTNVRPTRIVVVVDRKLRNSRRKGNKFHPVNNQVFIDDLEANEVSQADEHDSPILYRIDKDEFANGMATARNNLIRLMEKDLFKARDLRQLIIENRPPTFKLSSTAYTLSGPASQQELNIDQRNAIEKVMSARDYALVLGMPGTGKTTTIAHIIRALVSQNKSVLLTSYTHTAVDNILLKIKDDNIRILRLGAVNKVHPEVRAFADLAGVPKKTIEELHSSWHESAVVATTCLGVNHGIFNARVFDYCIVDEASQITLPVCLGPIRMAKTFILVGDHYQLPPLVQNKEAQEGGLDVSLFKLLSDAQPNSVVNLEHQYRMAEDIMLLSKELVYNGRIKCGTASVACRLLSIPDLNIGLEAHHHNAGTIASSSTPTKICAGDSQCWLRQSLTPQNRCIFLNTDSIGPKGTGQETATGSRITNPTESVLTAQLVTTLIRAGISPRSIGVITFYRSQLALLRRDVRSIAGVNSSVELEMHTADKYQGRDKEVVILSCVRSNDKNHVGELLKDWRRVNVAVTRARSKLIIIGSKSTMSGSGVPILEGIVKIMDNKNWINDLPSNAIEGHHFESSQLTQTPWTRQKDGNGESGKKSPVQTSGQNVLQEKQPRAFKRPAKVAQGGIDVDKLLDKSPIMRDILSDLDGYA